MKMWKVGRATWCLGGCEECRQAWWVVRRSASRFFVDCVWWNSGHSTSLPFRTGYPPKVDSERNGTTRPLRPRGSFRHACVGSQISFRSTSTERNHFAKLISRFRSASAKTQILFRFVLTEGGRSATLSPPDFKFIPFRVHCNIAFRQSHFPLPSRFRRISIFVPFRVHGWIAFRQSHLPLPLRFRRISNFVPFRVNRRIYNPPTSFSASVTLPPNLKFCSVPCPPKEAIPPRFRRIYIWFRSATTGKSLRGS